MTKQSIYGMRAQAKQAEPRSAWQGVRSAARQLGGTVLGGAAGFSNIFTAHSVPGIDAPGWAAMATKYLGPAVSPVAEMVGAAPQPTVAAMGVGAATVIGAMIGYDASRSKTTEQAGRRADLRHGIASKKPRTRAGRGQPGPDRDNGRRPRVAGRQGPRNDRSGERSGGGPGTGLTVREK